MITIIDYKTGNLGSIQNILRKIGESSVITSNPADIINATKIILPGVGSFDTGMRNLIDLDLVGILNKKVLEEKIPILGICLGMQLLSEKSKEGKLPGLGWIKGEVIKFELKNTDEYKIPHMGWNFVNLRKESRLFRDMYPDPRFYFVHSYHFKPCDISDILTSTNYELEFISSVERDNIIGVQFHPEKSHKFGMRLLKNFVECYK
jgi:glutamine amidotransferase